MDSEKSRGTMLSVFLSYFAGIAEKSSVKVAIGFASPRPRSICLSRRVGFIDAVLRRDNAFSHAFIRKFDLERCREQARDVQTYMHALIVQD